MDDWAKNVASVVEAVFEEHSLSLAAELGSEALNLVWQAMTSGAFFIALIVLLIAIVAIQSYTIPMAPIVGPFAGSLMDMLGQLALEGLVALGLGITATASVGAAIGSVGLAYYIMPETSSFWKEGVGLGVMGIIAATTSAWTASLIGPASILGDPFGLMLSFLGLFVQLSAIHIPDPIIMSIIGLAIAGVGFLWTLKGDVLDLLSPLAKIEEIIAGVGFAYCVVDSIISGKEWDEKRGR
jgi:hypothetical protein